MLEIVINKNGKLEKFGRLIRPSKEEIPKKEVAFCYDGDRITGISDKVYCFARIQYKNEEISKIDIDKTSAKVKLRIEE